MIKTLHYLPPRYAGPLTKTFSKALHWLFERNLLQEPKIQKTDTHYGDALNSFKSGVEPTTFSFCIWVQCGSIGTCYYDNLVVVLNTSGWPCILPHYHFIGHAIATSTTSNLFSGGVPEPYPHRG